MHNVESSIQTRDLVRLTALRYRVGTVDILRDIALTVKTGERVALLGANGAGKTSLLRMIHGLLTPSAGTVAAPAANEQAMIFQKPLLLKRTTSENVDFALRARGVEREAARMLTAQTLERCGILSLADRYARTLSGGEQQKLALARAWALKPTLLLADEPTASLAPAAVLALEQLMRAMCANGTSLIFATHNRGQARRLATRVLMMSEGRIVEDCAADQFFSNPVSQEAIEYLNVERI
jgi:tungstate transport system ATP-binding protein